MILDDHRWS